MFELTFSCNSEIYLCLSSVLGKDGDIRQALAFFDLLGVHCASGWMSCLKSTTLTTWIHSHCHSRLRTLFLGASSQIKKDSGEARNLEKWSGRLHRCINCEGERVWTPNSAGARYRSKASSAWTYPYDSLIFFPPKL